MGPIDYSGVFASMTPQASMMAGVKDGAAIQQLQVERAQAQVKAQRQQQMQAKFATLAQNPTAQGIAQISIEFPEFSEQLKRSYDMWEPAEKTARIGQALAVDNALSSGKPDIAARLLREHATAARNGGKEDEAKAAESKAEMVEKDPGTAQVILGSTLSALMGPDKYVEMKGKMGTEARAAELQPSAVAKADADASGAQADAATKGVTAKYAEQNALADYEKKGWDIKSIQSDIAYKRESNRIAAMNAAYNKEGNELKREELRAKIDDAKRGRDEKVRDYVAQGETEISSVTDTKDLIDTILSDEDSLRAVTGMGAWKGAIPGTVNRSMAGKVEQLVNMAAAMNLDKLKGPMSDKDILFVKRISANLDRYQDEDTFIADMKKFRSIAERTEGKLRAKYGAPAAQAKPAPAKATAIPDGWTVQVR